MAEADAHTADGAKSSVRQGGSPAQTPAAIAPTIAPQAPSPAPTASVAPFIIGGSAVVVALFAGLGLWAASTNIAGAVIAPATVVVDSNVKKVQHPTGGIVGAIHVRNGDRVKAGDMLMQLDDTQTRANLQIITNQIDETDALLARLKTEQFGGETVSYPDHLKKRAGDPAVRQILDSENVLFTSRRDSLKGQEQQLRERIQQLQNEIDGLSAQRTAKAIEIELISNELLSLANLEKQRLVPASKMIALRREAARLKGELARLDSGVAQAKGRIAEVEIVIIQKKQEFDKEVAGAIREAQTRLAELNERRVAAEDQLKRVDIISPDTGFVHELAVHTVGGVVSPGEPMMLIVPDGDTLTLEARVAPRDREQISQGATTKIRFAAFNQRTTPELTGTVKLIAADLTEDKRTGLGYYSVRIGISESELEKIAGLKLVPGLPADVQIRTEDRTALSYLIKPIEDQFAKAFRER